MMNKAFQIGFIKRAQDNGLTPKQACDLYKEAINAGTIKGLWNGANQLTQHMGGIQGALRGIPGMVQSAGQGIVQGARELPGAVRNLPQAAQGVWNGAATQSGGLRQLPGALRNAAPAAVNTMSSHPLQTAAISGIAGTGAGMAMNDQQ